MALSLDLSLVNAALSRTGTAQPLTISSLATGGKAQELVQTNYEEMVTGALSEYPWKFATKIVELNRLDPDVEGDPPEPWTAAYQLPTDILDLRAIKVRGCPIFYAVHGNKILCDAASSDHVIAHYLWRVPEVNMRPWFRELMIRRLEVLFLRGIGERYDEADSREKKAILQLAVAKNRDAQEEPPKDPFVSPTLLTRLGFVYPPTMPWR
jgi:hypothetical protein